MHRTIVFLVCMNFESPFEFLSLKIAVGTIKYYNCCCIHHEKSSSPFYRTEYLILLYFVNKTQFMALLRVDNRPKFSLQRRNLLTFYSPFISHSRSNLHRRNSRKYVDGSPPPSFYVQFSAMAAINITRVLQYRHDFRDLERDVRSKKCPHIAERARTASANVGKNIFPTFARPKRTR